MPVVRLPAIPDLTLDSSVMIIAPNGFDEDDDHARLVNDTLLSQSVSVAEVQVVVEHARQQRANCTPRQICDALRFYLTHDAFLELDDAPKC